MVKSARDSERAVVERVRCGARPPRAGSLRLYSGNDDSGSLDGLVARINAYANDTFRVQVIRSRDPCESRALVPRAILCYQGMYVAVPLAVVGALAAVVRGMLRTEPTPTGAPVPASGGASHSRPKPKGKGSKASGSSASAKVGPAQHAVDERAIRGGTGVGVALIGACARAWRANGSCCSRVVTRSSRRGIAHLPPPPPPAQRHSRCTSSSSISSRICRSKILFCSAFKRASGCRCA